MKKTLIVLIAVVFLAMACEKNTYIDGTYYVSYDAPHNGYTAFVEFALEDDNVTDIDFDYFNEAGDMMKSADMAYASNMFPVAGTSPDIFCPLIETQLLEAVIEPEFVEIDGVTGATGSTADANYLFGVALEAALSGVPTTQTVPEP